jgi:hydrogenase maturation protease
MKATPGGRIAVLGLGNLMRTDDGAGLKAARRVLEDSRLPREVQVIEGGAMGLDLLYSLEGITHLLALDAVETGAEPGARSRFAGQELVHLPVGKSVHRLGFADLLDALKLLGEGTDEVVLLGIQPESTGWGVTLSPAVDACLGELVDAAFEQISAWSAAKTSRIRPAL